MAIQAPTSPIIINISKPPKDDVQGLADVLVGALGLSGALILAAVLLAVILAAGLIWWRSRVGLDVDPAQARDEHIL